MYKTCSIEQVLYDVGMRRKHSALVHILRALIPYTEENLLLSFSPNRFFNELEKSSGYNKSTLRNTYDRARRDGYINKQSPRLTKEGELKIQPFIATRLGGHGKLMVIFDVPEDRANDRRRLRTMLKEWNFRQVQKSVWESDMDYEEPLIDVIAELKLGRYVEIFEGARIFPSKKQ